MVDGNDEVLSSSQVGRTDHQPSASSNTLAPGGRHRGSVHYGSRASGPRVRNHGEGNLSGNGGGRFHAYTHLEQDIPHNAFGGYGDAYPTPPTAWQTDTPDQNTNQGSWPLQQSQQYDTSVWQHDPADFPSARMFAASSNACAAYVPNRNLYLRPEVATHPSRQMPHAQPDSRESRHPIVPAADDEIEDEENPSEDERERESGEEQESTRATATQKPQKVSKSKQMNRRGLTRGLTRINVHGELEWMATIDSKGGKIPGIRFSPLLI